MIFGRMVEKPAMKVPKLLVLGNSLPGSRDGGGVVKDEILKRYPEGRYVCAAIEPSEDWKGDTGENGSLKGPPCLMTSLVPRLRLRGARFYMPLLRFIGFRLFAPWCVRQIVEFGKSHGVDLVWAELQYDALILAEKVAKGLGVPFVGTVWDDPEGWFSDRGYDRFSQRLFRRQFINALHAARNLSTAGEAMQSTYEKDYGVKSVILRHGFETPALPSDNPKKERGIVVGFAGSIYGRDAWEAFLSAIACLNASGRLPPVEVRIFGKSEFPYQHYGVRIETRGWRSAEAMLNEIAETDFCYLPYWFEPKKRRHVELSFPNKFETYLAAGRPILYHGPEYAGIVETINQYGVGLCVHSLNKEEISSVLERMIADHYSMNVCNQSAISAFKNEFNAETMLKNFALLINVHRSIFPGKNFQ
jgi:glycosyltransferase involved in cell wall biosynthesis